jgi:hypothetical protein
VKTGVALEAKALGGGGVEVPAALVAVTAKLRKKWRHGMLNVLNISESKVHLAWIGL